MKGLAASFFAILATIMIFSLSYNSTLSYAQSSTSVQDAQCINYDDSNRRISILCGSATLSDIDKMIDDPSVLNEESDGIWMLQANLTVANSSGLRLDPSDTSWLKISTPLTGNNLTSGANVNIVYGIEVYGDLVADSVKITSWNTSSNSYAQTDGHVPRPYITMPPGGTGEMKITNSDIGYLGYYESLAQGISLYAGDNSVLKNNTIHHNWYGFYSNGVRNLTIVDNHIYDNLLYGLDPHTGTRDVIIRNNLIHGTAQGIGLVCSLDCDNILMEQNTLYNNSLAAIMLSRNTINSIVRNNTIYQETKGIVISESHSNAIYHNRIQDSEIGIESKFGSSDNTIFNNSLAGIGKYGITIRDGSFNNTVMENKLTNVRQDGICVYNNASSNLILSNAIMQSDRHGICIHSSALDNVIKSNNIEFVIGYGIVVADQDATGNIIEANTIRNAQGGVRLINNTGSTFPENSIAATLGPEYVISDNSLLRLQNVSLSRDTISSTFDSPELAEIMANEVAILTSGIILLSATEEDNYGAFLMTNGTNKFNTTESQFRMELQHGDSITLSNNQGLEATRKEKLDQNCVDYDRSNRMISIICGSATFIDIDNVLHDPAILKEESPGIWLLNASLRVGKDSNLIMNNSSVRWLKIETPSLQSVGMPGTVMQDPAQSIPSSSASQTLDSARLVPFNHSNTALILGRNGSLHSIYGIEVYGDLVADSVKITSWNTSSNSYAQTDGDTPRPYILVPPGGQGTVKITSSEIAYLGSGVVSRGQGLTFLSGSGNLLVNNTIHHNWFGFYSEGIGNITIEGNAIHDNIRYGLDPHTGTHDLIVNDNFVYNNGHIGIICSMDCFNIQIKNNRVMNNSGAGIMLSKNVHNSSITDNLIYNEEAGISISESHSNYIARNELLNGTSGIELKYGSFKNVASNNVISHVSECGIRVSDGASMNIVNGNSIFSSSEDGVCVFNNASRNEISATYIQSPGNFGIAVMDQSSQDNMFRDNILEDNALHAVGLFNNTSTFLNNTISDTRHSEFLLTAESSLLIVDNNFSNTSIESSSSLNGTNRVYVADTKGNIIKNDKDIEVLLDPSLAYMSFELSPSEKVTLSSLDFSIKPNDGFIGISRISRNFENNELYREFTQTTYDEQMTSNVVYELNGFPPNTVVKVFVDDSSTPLGKFYTDDTGNLEFELNLYSESDSIGQSTRAPAIANNIDHDFGREAAKTTNIILMAEK